MSKVRVRSLIGLGALGVAAFAGEATAQQAPSPTPPPASQGPAVPGAPAAPQEPALAPPAWQTPPPPEQSAPPPPPPSISVNESVEQDAGSAASAPETATQSGFETGLRTGIGLPLGNAGQDPGGVDRSVSDLTPWRMPIWIDVGYRTSDTTLVGAYVQMGLGASGDACANECDWTDIRVGVEGQWRLTPSEGMTPWLGAGFGYESLSIHSLEIIQVTRPGDADPTEFPARTTERLGGVELLLQGGLDFKVEESLWLGPYLSATVAQYFSDGFKCDFDDTCPAGGLDGAALHSWVGVGVRGTYFP
jgi:hypothetical protein